MIINTVFGSAPAGSGALDKESSMTAVTSSSDARHASAPARASLSAPARRSLAVLRLTLGMIFLWAFLDKTFGLGFATAPEKAWIAGGSPAGGYLGSLEGAFAPLFAAMAGQPWVDVSFMLGMLAVGSALILGVAMRAAAVGGTIIMALMWLSSLPLENHPVIDDHVIYAAALWVLFFTGAGRTWGAGRIWESQAPHRLRFLG
jgi:thiosulfate dehydrogenase (quinone) large subunit